VAARAVAGGFGGLIAANVLAAVGDVFGAERRGTAMGIVMWGFSLATIAGVPAGLIVAEELNDWRAPFAGLAGLGLVLLILCWLWLPPLRGHLGPTGCPPRASLWQVLTHPNHLPAYALSTALVLSTFMVIPFLAAYLVDNVGRPKDELPLVYVVGGLTTLVSGPLIGWLSDRYGKLLMLRVLATLAVVPILVYTHLPPVSLPVALVVATLFMVLASGRMVPAMALITGCAEPHLRGGFLSVNASVQQMAMGLAAAVAGQLITEGPGGALEGFGTVGVLASAAALLSVILAGRLRTAPGGGSAPDAKAV
jgi:predicted MFS family arabinose efflux permease